MARHSFQLTDTIPHVAHAGDTFYLVGLIIGFLLWGFALVWFVVAIIMIITAYPFPFNMGWWGFIFPIGESPNYSAQVVQYTHCGDRSVHAFDDRHW